MAHPIFFQPIHKNCFTLQLRCCRLNEAREENMTQELQQGVFTHYTREQYDAIPAMRSSYAVKIIQDCPYQLKWDMDHPEKSAAMDLGSAAHILFLEPEKFETEVVVIEADDWRTNAAKDARQFAYDENKIPLLPKELEKIKAMRAAFFKNQAMVDYTTDVKIENTIIWQDPKTKIWCKAKPDIIGKDPAGVPFMANFKTQSSVNPDFFGRHMNDMGYHQQADFYLQGYKIVTGEILDYVYLAQEKDAPYMSVPFRCDNTSMEAAFRLNRRAIELYAYCMETGDWHGHRPFNTPKKDGVITVAIPGWALQKMEDRFEQERAGGIVA